MVFALYKWLKTNLKNVKRKTKTNIRPVDAGTEVQLENKDYLIMRESDIFAIL